MMTQDLGQQEQQPKERIYQVGEWFHPFPLFSDDQVEYAQPEWHRKSNPIMIDGFGKTWIELDWNQDVINGGFDGFKADSAVILLPDMDVETPLSSVRDYQEKLQARLLIIRGIVDHEAWINDKFPFSFWVDKKFQFPYSLQVKGGSGTIFEVPFEMPTDDDISTWQDKWKTLGKSEKQMPLISDSENSLAGIEVRIVNNEASGEMTA